VTLTALTRREASIFACVVDTLVDPGPALPPVADTDAVEHFDAWLAAASPLHRRALRALLLGLEVAPRLLHRGGRLRRLPPPARARLLGSLERVPALRDVLRTFAAMSYYGDAGVLRALGHDTDEVLRRARRLA
jgi:hypothetical protein